MNTKTLMAKVAEVNKKSSLGQVARGSALRRAWSPGVGWRHSVGRQPRAPAVESPGPAMDPGEGITGSPKNLEAKHGKTGHPTIQLKESKSWDLVIFIHFLFTKHGIRFNGQPAVVGPKLKRQRDVGHDPRMERISIVQQDDWQRNGTKNPNQQPIVPPTTNCSTLLHNCPTNQSLGATCLGALHPR